MTIFFSARRFTNPYLHKTLPMVTGWNNVTRLRHRRSHKLGRNNVALEWDSNQWTVHDDVKNGSAHITCRYTHFNMTGPHCTLPTVMWPLSILGCSSLCSKSFSEATRNLHWMSLTLLPLRPQGQQLVGKCRQRADNNRNFAKVIHTGVLISP